MASTQTPVLEAATGEDVPCEEVTGEDATGEDVPCEATGEDAPREDVPREEAICEDAPCEDATGEDAPREEATGQDAPREDAPREDVPREEATGEDAPCEEVTGEDAPRQEATGEDTPQWIHSVASRADIENKLELVIDKLALISTMEKSLKLTLREEKLTTAKKKSAANDVVEQLRTAKASYELDLRKKYLHYRVVVRKGQLFASKPLLDAVVAARDHWFEEREKRKKLEAQTRTNLKELKQL